MASQKSDTSPRNGLQKNSRYIAHEIGRAKQRSFHLATNQLDVDHQRQLATKIDPVATARVGVDVRRVLFQQHAQQMDELISPVEYINASEVRGCLLPYNHAFGRSIQDPFTVRSIGEESPPPDIDERLFFTDLDQLPSGRAHSFGLTSKFPISDNRNTTVAHLPYRFDFSVGSSGRYCFLPLPHVLGTLSYSSTDPNPDPAQMILYVSYGVREKGGAMLAIDSMQMTIQVASNDFTLVAATLNDFLASDSSASPLVVDLAGPEAEIDVWLTLLFLNGLSYHSPNANGDFYMDCSSRSGSAGCELLKWGRWETQPQRTRPTA